MWVQLLTVKQIEVRGKPTTYYPGDWVEVGKHDAMRWVAACEARAAEEEVAHLVPGAGIVARFHTDLVGYLTQQGYSALIGDPQLAYPRTLIWEPSLTLRLELLPVGFHLLDRWEVAVPLTDYAVLAAHIGEEDERAKTQAVIRDLRVPVYDTRLLFIKQCQAGRDLLDAWNVERCAGDERLAFLRALYAVQPLVCALPCTWVNVWKG